MNLSLEIAKNTLIQTQTALSVATNNLANQTVDGYTRQTANLKTNMSINSSGGMMLGTGATITSIDRVRTGFYDKQYRDNLGVYKNATTFVDAFKRLETIMGTFNGDTSLKSSLNNFFDSLEELSKNPEKIGVKQVVKDTANAVVYSFNLIASNIDVMENQYQSITNSKVTEVNSILKSLQIVNDEIGRLTAMGEQPNDLLDERDRLIDSLSGNMDISIIHGDNNKINIISNGHVMVQDGYYSELKFVTNVDGSFSVKYENGADFVSKGGELVALIDIIDKVIPTYKGQIDTLAKDFVDSFNALHRTGVASDGTTGVNFFEGSTASDIKVTDAIEQDPGLIMTSTDGTSGNNELILNLLTLKDGKVIDGGKYGVLEYFDNIASSIATEANSMKTKVSNYKYITDEIYIARSNETGVNEDEELLTTVKLQQTYSAASKVISTLNEMFNSLINAI